MYFLIATTSFTECGTTAGVNTVKKSCLYAGKSRRFLFYHNKIIFATENFHCRGRCGHRPLHKYTHEPRKQANPKSTDNATARTANTKISARTQADIFLFTSYFIYSTASASRADFFSATLNLQMHTIPRTNAVANQLMG